MIDQVGSRTPLRAMANMAMLYAGKTSGVLVAFVFLPLYSRLLGPEQFGVVAVILSLQALLMMLDLGMSTLVSRDVAVAKSSSTELLQLIRTAELGLTAFYIVLLAGTAVFKIFGGMPGVSFGVALGPVLLFWLLVLQNIYYSAMLARRAYTVASLVQVLGVVARAGITAYVLANVSATITAFIISQVILGAIHFGITRFYFSSFFYQSPTTPLKVKYPTIQDAVALLKRGKSLALFALAGAAVTQLDKPIVSAFVSAASLAPYFLATTLCMVPISVLAGPVSQYFQPMLLRSAIGEDRLAARRVVKQFVGSLLLVTVIPSVCFWIFRAPIIELWMGKNASNSTIANYVGILLPGFTMGALGFIPYSLLISVNDFKFQAVLSGAMTVITLAAAASSAMLQSVEGVCFVYASYHTFSTLLSWVRTMYLPTSKELGRISFYFAISNLTILSLIALAVSHLVD
jgi:O-antigen/teichoic acid export membrane protein